MYFKNLKKSVISTIYFLIKSYRICFFLKIIFDQLPLFSPNKWPLSPISGLASPLIRFSQYYLPTINIGPLDLSVTFILILETFEALINFLEDILLDQISI